MRAKDKLDELGIELIDVQLRRIAYEKSVDEKVYDRMISERKRIAEKIRSTGKGEQAKIQGKLNQDLKEIESSAYRKSQEIRGRGEAEAIAIYAKSLGIKVRPPAICGIGLLLYDDHGLLPSLDGMAEKRQIDPLHPGGENDGA